MGMGMGMGMGTYGETLEGSERVNHGNHRNRILFTNTAFRS